MLTEAFWLAAATWVVCVAFTVPFVASVREEAPAIYESWGCPNEPNLMSHNRIWWPFSGMLLSRQYRRVLATYPRSRAWASWLFYAHCLQLLGLAVFAISLIWPATSAA
jgi:hypothetical protein